MMRYSVQPRDRIFEYFCLLLKNIGNNISKDLSGKYSQKCIDRAKQSAADALKTTSKRAIQKIAETAGDLVGNETANKSTAISKTSQQNDSETVTNEYDKEILKERYKSTKERQKIVDDLRLI